MSTACAENIYCCAERFLWYYKLWKEIIRRNMYEIKSILQQRDNTGKGAGII